MAVSSNVYPRLKISSFVGVILALTAYLPVTAGEVDSLMSLYDVQVSECDYLLALSTAERAESLATAVHGEHPDAVLLASRLNLADALERMDREQRALNLIDTGIIELAQGPAGGYPQLARAMVLQAMCFTDLHRHKIAEDVIDGAFRIIDKHCTGDTVLLIKALKARALLYDWLDRYDEQYRDNVRASKLTLATHGEHSVEYGEFLALFGKRLTFRSKLDSAHLKYFAANQIATASKKRGRALLASIILWKASQIKFVDDYPAKKDLEERALQLRLTMYGQTHYDVAIVLLYLAGTQRWLGSIEDAEFRLEMAREVNDSLYGRGSYLSTKVLEYESDIAYAKEEYETAVELGEKRIEILEAMFDEDNTVVGRAYSSLNLNQRANGDEEDALTSSRKTVSILAVAGSIREQAHARHMQAHCTREAGQRNEAIRLYKEAIELYDECLGPYSFEAARAYMWMGFLEMKTSQTHQAEKHLLTSVVVFKREFGEDSAWLLRPYSWLSYTYGYAGYKKQEQKYRTLYNNLKAKLDAAK